MSESQLNTNDDLLDAVLGDFLDESDQLLTQFNENLLQLDEWVQSLDENHQQRCDEDLMNEMFRAAHSLKGLSAMLGLTDINNLTHKIENVFEAARTDKLIINGDVTELLFMGLDQLVALIDLLKEPDSKPVDCGVVLESIRRLLQSAGAEQAKGSQADVDSFMRSSGEQQGEELLSVSSTDAATSGPESETDPFEGLQDEKKIPDKYLSIFIDESEDSLDRLTSALLALESDGEGNELKSLMCTAHKIKGSAASIGLNRVAKLAHLMEDLLEKLVQTGGRLSAETADVLHKCTDGLGQYVADLKGGTGGSDHFGQLARELLAAQLGDFPSDVGSANSNSPGTFHETPPVDESLSGRLESVLTEILVRLESADIQDVTSATGMAADTIQQVREGESKALGSFRALAAYFDGTADSANGRTTYVGEVKFQSDLPTAGMKAELIYEKLIKLGDVSDCQPTPEQLGKIDTLDYFRFRVTTDQSLETVIQQARVAGVQDVSVKPIHSSPAMPQCVSGSPGTQATLFAPPSNTAQSPARTGPVKYGQPESKPVAAEGEESTAKPERTQTAMKTNVDKGLSSTPEKSKTVQSVAESGTVPASPIPEAQHPVEKADQRKPESGRKPTQTVRVEIDRLDQLMDLAGQLVINKSQFSQIGDKLKTLLSCRQFEHVLNKVSAELDKIGGHSTIDLDGQRTSMDLERIYDQVRRIQNNLEPLRCEVQILGQARDCVQELFEAIHQLGRVSDGIQQGVMDTRMVPIGPLFSRFKRVIRDITRANDKNVRLVIKGENTELDKRMIDELGDPLVHMIRNSADHGIELPDDREKAGKPRQGTVTLDAFHRGNSIVIQVRDDGKGLDSDRILQKCLEKGLLTKADAEKITPHEIHQMIWEPGLSTAEKVTDVSGRGMGMDIVKSRIDDLNGTVDVDSMPGQGTTITIKLPLTLAILPSLMVDIRGGVFAMPLETVSEIVSVSEDQLSTVHGLQMATVRGRVVSLVRLGDVLSFHGASGAVKESQSRETTLVIVGEKGQEIGMAVDQVIGEDDIVIKSIAENYKNIPGIAGASILGDGRVSLILDVPSLIEMVSKKTTSVSC